MEHSLKHHSKLSVGPHSEMGEEGEISEYGSEFYIPPEVNQALSHVSRGSEIKVHFATAPEDVDLDKLFGFSRAEQLAGTFQPEEVDEIPSGIDVVPHRIFVNQVDTFFGRYFVRYLASQVYSFPRPDGEPSSSEEPESSDEVEEEEVSEEEEIEGGGEENVESYEQLMGNMERRKMEEEDGENDQEEFGDYDEDPFAFLAEEDDDDQSEEEIEKVGGLFPVERSDTDLRNLLRSDHIGDVDLRKLKPEEYMELLDITSEDAKVRFLKSILSKRHRKRLQKRMERLEQRRLKAVQRKLKYSKTHKPFEIFGTLQRSLSPDEKESEQFKYLENVHIVPGMSENRERFLDLMMTCGTVVFNITPCQTDQAEEAKWTIQAMTRRLQDKELEDREAFKKNLTMRTFLLLSPMLTWANTIPLETEGSTDLSEMAFIEDDFRRRNPHENFKKIYRAENETLNCGQKYKKKLKTLVINTGVLYGHEEEVLDFLFVHTWRCETDTPMFDNGDNLIPLIHIDTLNETLYKIIRKSPFIKLPLIFVMERKCLTLEEICQVISALGTGAVMRMKKELSFILPGPGIDQVSYDQLTANINVTPKYLVEHLDPRFAESFKENGTYTMKQYVEANRLEPRRILIDGLPLSGKTRLAMKLCTHYNLHYLTRETIVQLYRDLLTERERDLKAKMKERSLDEATREGENQEEESENVDGEELKNVQKKLVDLKHTLYEGNGQISDDKVMLGILAELFTFKKIINIGYVLDGWPETCELVKEAFENNETMAPNIFIRLDVQEELCLRRIYDLPEDYLKTHPVDETILVDRIFAYRNRNKDAASTLTSYFESAEFPVRIFILDANQEINFHRLRFDIGPARDAKFWIPILGLDTSEPAEETSDPSRETHGAISEADARQLKLSEYAAEELSRRREAREAEHRVMAIYADRARKYAQRYLMPTLCRGLLETAGAKPARPVEFLAEYLFRNNPDGKVLSDTQRRRFGEEHVWVNDEDRFRQLQEMVEKKAMYHPTMY